MRRFYPVPWRRAKVFVRASHATRAVPLIREYSPRDGGDRFFVTAV